MVGDHASDDRASAGGHTSDAADDDVGAVATFHLYLLDLHDAYDADRAAMVVLNLDHDDSQVLASFHLGDQLHCFHYLVETLYFCHVDQLLAVDSTDHHSAVSGQSLAVVDNHFLLNSDYYHFVNVPVLLLMVVLVMPCCERSDLKSLRTEILSQR